MIKELHIFDFDGTLVDSSHRYRTQTVDGLEKIDLQYWIENEHKAMNDKPLPLMDTYKKLMADSIAFPIIATARIWDSVSQAFAKEHGISGSVIARKDRFDNRGGAALKISGLKRFINLKQFAGVEIVHVYEDNKQYLTDLVNFFADNGFRVCGHYVPSNQGH